MTTVREATPDDVPAIRDVHVASISGLAASHYDDHQIESWSDVDEDDYSVSAEGAYVIVAQTGTADGDDAEADGEIAGFGAVPLESGEVRTVYVHPDHAGEGVGSAILGELEERACGAGLSELHLTASLNAVQIYERLGWESTGQTIHELAVRLELDARAMEK